jgi:hypothetical protein
MTALLPCGAYNATGVDRIGVIASSSSTAIACLCGFCGGAGHHVTGTFTISGGECLARGARRRGELPGGLRRDQRRAWWAR